MTNSPPPPILTGDATSFHDLVCTICQEIPYLYPVITRCDHVFCKACITESLSRSDLCPNDRAPLSRSRIAPMTGVIRRVWEKIGVQCPMLGCGWSGTMGGYKSHISERCGNSTAPYVRQIEALQNRIGTLESQVSTLTGENARLRININEDKQGIMTLTEDNAVLHTYVTELKETINGHESEKLRTKKYVEKVQEACKMVLTTPNFDKNYAFDRSRVVELTQLICKYLENPPAGPIDTNRIYNFVKNCYDDLQRGWIDNPAHYDVDVRMLLNVALATNGWFSDKQLQNLRRWCNESFGSGYQY
jgi:hypothetical protein